ncbi:MAG: hypothetical protein MJ237_02610 [bacterium]|nr:hypothetical protein [bacterium]
MKKTLKMTLALSVAVLFTVMSVNASTFETTDWENNSEFELYSPNTTEFTQKEIVRITPSRISNLVAKLLKRNQDCVAEDMLLESYMLGVSANFDDDNWTIGYEGEFIDRI